ncbi:MAG: HAMP domain-containing histidine kinase [Spirochaetes bacterium]|nr:HAMP domain-containing histidine kinase [Spirochaetota bacterium]MBU1079656.1 HAMP domain-containing histidine kinase [Spirochaetota bacterium]
MLGRGISSRRATDLTVVAMLYAIVLAGSFTYLLSEMGGGEGFPGIRSKATAAILAVTPTMLAAVLAVSGARFARDYKRRAWGYRLRARVLAYFVAVAAMAAVPSSLMLGMIAIRAVELPSSGLVRSALSDGVDLALGYYADKEAALRYAAENDVAPVVSARGLDAERVLARLSARDSSICAVELFSAGRSASFAGERSVRSSPGAAAMDKNGFLPRLSSGGRSYARYFASDAGETEAGRVSAVVSLCFDEETEYAAAGLSAALSTLERSGRIAGSFPLYLIFFGACLASPFLAMALLFALGASDRLLRPIAALSDAIARVGSGARRAPFLAKPGDEAGELVESLNRVLEDLERSRGDELRSEKIGAWRDIARKLAHELRNPLTPIRLSAERVLKRWNNDPSSIGDILERSMVAIVQETANMESLLTEFRDFARLPEPQKDWMELKPTVEEVVHLYSASWPALEIDCREIDPGISLKADRGYLKQALGNLIANAADATDRRGHVWIRADLVKTAESRYCRIQVRDDGHGIPSDVQDKVFSPYFTTKPGGTGLGLAIVEHIVAAHGGKIRFDSGPNAGTVFYIDLPAESIIE